MLDRADNLAIRAIAASSAVGDSTDVVDAQIEQLFRLVLSRDPTNAERQQSLAVVTNHGLTPLSRALLNCSEFLFIP
ncbi:MAG: hypothetical protein WKF77_09665 [Planctomycetaceae bacterium]